MFRILVLAAGLGMAVAGATPAAADVTLTCFSVDLRCRGFVCPPGSVQVVNTGFEDTGPWLVVCRPAV